MDWLQFISSIVESLAWPGSIVVLVLVLRSPVSRLLLALTRLKYKDLELDFGAELRELTDVAAKTITIEAATPAALPAPATDTRSYLSEATRLAPDFPEPAVAVGWQAVEESLLNAIDRLGLAESDQRNAPATRNIELLRSNGHLDDGTVDILKRMRNLRNVAVHGGHGFGPVSVSDANEFIALATGVVKKLNVVGS